MPNDILEQPRLSNQMNVDDISKIEKVNSNLMDHSEITIIQNINDIQKHDVNQISDIKTVQNT